VTCEPTSTTDGWMDDPSEDCRIRGAWVSAPPSGTAAVVQRFRAVVEGAAARPAISDLTTETDYDTLAAWVSATASHLVRAAREPGPVLVAIGDVTGSAVGFLASAAAGRAVVPCDTRSGPRALRMLAARTSAAVLVAPASDAGTAVGIPVVRPVTGVDAGSRLLREFVGHDVAEWSPVVRITNTSGSTGAPRLIADRAAVIHGRTLPDLDVPRPPERIASNVAAAGGFLTRMVQALLSGDLFIGFTLDDRPPSEVVARLRAASITRLTVTPSVLRRLAQAGRESAPGTAERALSTVREVWTIGEPLQWSDVAAARRLCGPHVHVRNAYGSTEAGIITEHVVGPDAAVGEGPVPVGRAVAGRGVHVRDDEGRVVTDGTVGRIVVEGRFTTEGVGFEELPDGRERYVSSDLGRVDADGVLHHLGRADDTVKVAGMRVETSAVEAVIRALPGVVDVAVVPITLAPGEVRLVAHVVTDPARPADPAVLRRLTGAAVTGVAVPARFVLHTEPLPLLPSGKVDRVRLAAGA
jgi:acyl-coenzyme A synthetase/AMP-(fatty) acid ligase